MEWLDAFRSYALALPNLAKFAILLALIVGVPALARRLRIPELVGLVVVGLLMGPHVLGLYGADHPIAQFFADLGRLMLMFAAGLEIDLDLFRKAQTRSITFGVITTIVPQALGTAYGLAFGYGIIPAIVIGSLLASHTLISLPIAKRLGALGLEPVVVTIGATMVSDTLSLIIFGICVSTYTPKLKKRTALVRALKEVFRRHRSQPIERVINLINPMLRGWVNYFAVGHSSECFSFIKDWVEKKIRRHLAHAQKRKGFGWERWNRQWLYDTLRLFNAYRVRRDGPKVAPAG